MSDEKINPCSKCGEVPEFGVRGTCEMCGLPYWTSSCHCHDEWYHCAFEDNENKVISEWNELNPEG